MAEKKEKRNVVFRRIGGRIVPISVGSALAYDAARTKVVSNSGGIKMVRKINTVQPLSSIASRKLVFGTTIKSYDNSGKRVGQILFNKYQGAGNVEWLSVKKKFQGKGHSKKLIKQAAIEMKRSGIDKLTGHAITKRSAKVYEGFKGVKTFASRGGKLTRNIKAGVYREAILPKFTAALKKKPYMSGDNKIKLALGLGFVGYGLLKKDEK